MPERKKASWLKWSLLALLVFVGFLLFTAPARLVPLVVSQLAPMVQLQHVTGSLWRGTVASAVVAMDGSALNLGKLSWRLNPLSILRLNPSLHIETDAGSHHLTADISVSLLSQQVEAEAVRGEFPISLLEPWVPMLVRGTIELDIERLAFDANSLRAAEGQLYVRRLDWVAGPRPLPLGSYTAELNVAQGSLLITLSDRQALLGVDGLLTINPAGPYQLEAVLSSTDELAPEITQSLKFLGRKNADGNFVLNNKGRWR